MILAVLEKKMGVSMIDQDVYVNIVGGIRPEGTYTDLAVAMAVYSSYRGIPVGGKTISFGEIGLTGDLRASRQREDNKRSSIPWIRENSAPRKERPESGKDRQGACGKDRRQGRDSACEESERNKKLF